MTAPRWLVPGAAAAAVAAALVGLPAEWIAGAEARIGAWSAWLGGARIVAIAGAYLWWDALIPRVPGLGPEGSGVPEGPAHVLVRDASRDRARGRAGRPGGAVGLVVIRFPAAGRAGGPLPPAPNAARRAGTRPGG